MIIKQDDIDQYTHFFNKMLSQAVTEGDAVTVAYVSIYPEASEEASNIDREMLKKSGYNKGVRDGLRLHTYLLARDEWIANKNIDNKLADDKFPVVKMEPPKIETKVKK
jgi:hypothetical protein